MSYMFTNEYEIWEWNLGRTFNYAEMAALIAPRPFMVERGHDDGVGIDEWVNYEFAKVRRLYNKLGIGDRTDHRALRRPAHDEIQRVEVAGERIVPDGKFLLDLLRELQVVFESAGVVLRLVRLEHVEVILHGLGLFVCLGGA